MPKSTEKTDKKNNGKLSLYPLKFEEAVKVFLQVKLLPKKDSKPKESLVSDLSK